MAKRSKAKPPRVSRRAFLAGGAAAGALLAVPGAAAQRLILNDASRLDPTPVLKHMVRTAEPMDTLVAALRAELKDAAASGRAVAVGAARHSMGGQSLPRDGTALDLDSREIAVDTKAKMYRAAAGVRWSDVIRTLDPLGFSPTVMQSNNDFGIASTFSVNAHGWPVPHGPFGSTVRSLRMMMADGSLVTCSRTENAELFTHAMGGYGLFGIILDLDVEMTENLMLVPSREIMPAERFGQRFIATIASDPQVKMAYGRLSLKRASFFEEAVMIAYRPLVPAPDALPPAGNKSMLTGVTNDLYRAQIGSEMMKGMRWEMETRMAPHLGAGITTRNTLINEPVANLINRSTRRTDILHEYFVSPDRFVDFLGVCRAIIPKAAAEFINVTLRYLAPDTESHLAYAPVPRISAVMSFSQEMTMEGEVDMLETTERLIDGILGIGGAFYLPYRLHARRDQVAMAYPATAAFVAKKRELDPGLVFRNAMWSAYFS